MLASMTTYSTMVQNNYFVRQDLVHTAWRLKCRPMMYDIERGSTYIVFFWLRFSHVVLFLHYAMLKKKIPQ